MYNPGVADTFFNDTELLFSQVLFLFILCAAIVSILFLWVLFQYWEDSNVSDPWQKENNFQIESTLKTELHYMKVVDTWKAHTLKSLSRLCEFTNVLINYPMTTDLTATSFCAYSWNSTDLHVRDSFFFLSFFFFFLRKDHALYRLPRWLSDKESTCQFRRPGCSPWVKKIPSWKKWQPTPVFLPRKSLGQRSLEGSKVHNLNSWDHKSWTQLSDWACMPTCPIRLKFSSSCQIHIKISVIVFDWTNILLFYQMLISWYFMVNINYAPGYSLIFACCDLSLGVFLQHY